MVVTRARVIGEIPIGCAHENFMVPIPIHVSQATYRRSKLIPRPLTLVGKQETAILA